MCGPALTGRAAEGVLHYDLVGLDGAYLVRRSLVWAVVSHLADWEAQTMNREDIIRMAREAGMDEGLDGWTTADPKNKYPEAVYTVSLERFAALVAAAEQKQTGQIVEELSNKALHAHLQAVAAEREACAQLCEDLFMSDGHWCAKQIRVRGQE